MLRFAALFILAVLFEVVRVNRKTISKVPGPWYSKWTGLIHKYHVVKGTSAIYIHDLHQVYGPIVRIAPNHIDVSDVAACREIYGVKETFLKSPWYMEITGNIGENVFNTRDIQLHRRHRKLLSGSMSESSIKTLMPTIADRVALTIQRMGQEMKEHGAADVLKWWMFMTTDIVAQLTFGDSFRMLELGKKNEYIRQLELAGVVTAIRSVSLTLVSVAAFLQLPFFKRAEQSAYKLQKYAEDALMLHKNLLLSDPTSVKKTLFTDIFRAKDEERLSWDEVRSNAQAYIIAGSDTTSNTLTYMVWSVCRHPEVKARLVEELKSLPEGYDESVLKDLPYLNQVIQETMRVFPTVPLALPRIVPAGGAQFCGFALDAGTTVGAQPYTLHRDPVVFPDPERFDPSRWAEPTKAMKDAFIGFGGGARVCLGLHLAKTEMRLGIARFFEAFPDAKVSSVGGMTDEDMKPEMYFLMAPQGHRCMIQAS